MHDYLPSLAALADVAITWGIGGVLLLAGGVLASRKAAPEFRFGAGWGGLCVLLTIWGVFLPVSLRVPAIAFAVLALAGLRMPAAEWRTIFRLMVVALPLWLVMAPIRPSQPDTFLNLLPNAVYLVDYGRFPTDALPPSFSFLPAAPYNTQFLAFLGGLDRSRLSGGGDVAGQRAAVPGRRAGDRPRPGGWDGGSGDPATLEPSRARTGAGGGAQPRLCAAHRFRRLRGAGAGGDGAAGGARVRAGPGRGRAYPRGGGQRQAVGDRARRGLARRAAPLLDRNGIARGLGSALAFSAAPAALLYGVWRWHVGHAGVAELTVLPFGQWHWETLPQILAGMVEEAIGKPVYFGAVAIALAVWPVLLRRQGWTLATRLLAFHAALFVLYNLFLILAYLGQFSETMSAAAHSYFRYCTHLSLVLVAALALAARDFGLGAFLTRHARPAAAAVLAVALIGPLGFAPRLRFDLAMPQPLVWNLAAAAKPNLADDDRLALVLPGDNGSVAAMLSGVLRDVRPRRPSLDLLSPAARRPRRGGTARLSPRRWSPAPPNATPPSATRDGGRLAAGSRPGPIRRRRAAALAAHPLRRAALPESPAARTRCAARRKSGSLGDRTQTRGRRQVERAAVEKDNIVELRQPRTDQLLRAAVAVDKSEPPARRSSRHSASAFAAGRQRQRLLRRKGEERRHKSLAPRHGQRRQVEQRDRPRLLLAGRDRRPRVRALGQPVEHGEVGGDRPRRRAATPSR